MHLRKCLRHVLTPHQFILINSSLSPTFQPVISSTLSWTQEKEYCTLCIVAHKISPEFQKKHEYDTVRAYSSATTNLTFPDVSLFKSILSQAICTTTRINHRKKGTQSHYGTYSPPVSFESHPLCSSRKDRIARPPDQVALQQSVRRVAHQYMRMRLKHAR